MKKLFLCLVCVVMLCGAVSLAEGMEPGYTPGFEGRWVSVADGVAEVYLPTAWKETSFEDGLTAEDTAAGVSMQLSVMANEGERTVDQLFEAFAADAGYKNVELAELGGLAYVVMENADGSAYLAATEIGGAQIFAFTFASMNTPELQLLAQEIMASLNIQGNANG